MTLRFDQVYSQVEIMGRKLAHQTQSLSERGQLALAVLREACDLNQLYHKIDVVRTKDAGYRGAAAHQEPICYAYRPTIIPNEAILIAVDGSQIYPNFHAPALYYLTNISYFIYEHGSLTRPIEGCQPHLEYGDKLLRERNGYGAVIKNSVVNSRRDVQEMKMLTQTCWEQPSESKPLIGLRDGRLLWWTGGDVPYANELTQEYYSALRLFHDVHHKRLEQNQANAILAGYVERGDSRFVIRLLHLLGLADEAISRAQLETSGEFEGLTDEWLFSNFLEPGERSAVMIQQSPINRDYKRDVGDAYEIAFFYLNVGSAAKPHVIRVEVPMWVVEADGAIDELHSQLLVQCELAGRYPYVLMRADELAVVSNLERRQLEEMINIELLKNNQTPEQSAKLSGKQAARAERQAYHSHGLSK